MARQRSASCVANGRNSPGQKLGVKAFGSEFVSKGSLIVRQQGTQFYPGLNVGLGRDHTLFALCDGKVTFGYTRGGKRKVSVAPLSLSSK